MHDYYIRRSIVKNLVLFVSYELVRLGKIRSGKNGKQKGRKRKERRVKKGGGVGRKMVVAVWDNEHVLWLQERCSSCVLLRQFCESVAYCLCYMIAPSCSLPSEAFSHEGCSEDEHFALIIPVTLFCLYI